MTKTMIAKKLLDFFDVQAESCEVCGEYIDPTTSNVCPNCGRIANVTFFRLLGDFVRITYRIETQEEVVTYEMVFYVAKNHCDMTRFQENKVEDYAKLTTMGKAMLVDLRNWIDHFMSEEEDDE